MKNVTRNNKLLLCFRPVVLELESNGVNCSGNKDLTCISVLKKEEDMKISRSESSLLDNDSAALSEENGRPFRPKRTFSKIIKAVLFQTSLSKTVRDPKIRQDSFRSTSSGNLSTKSEDSINLKKEKSAKMKSIDPDDKQSIKSRPNSMRYSSSLSSLSSTSCPMRELNAPNSSNPSSINTEQKRNSEMKMNLMGLSSLNNGLYLILVILAVTIFWGKFCAVLLTSIWLYFDLRRRKLGDSRSENGVQRIQEKSNYGRTAPKEPESSS